MIALQHFALGCCILCALAGVLNVFWPDNSYKPVINTVLVLYTLASVAELGKSADWAAVRREVQGLEAQPQTVPQQTLEEYAQALALESSARALAEMLRKAGVPCTAEVNEGTAVFRLEDASDADTAAGLLQKNAGELAWRLETEVKP